MSKKELDVLMRSYVDNKYPVLGWFVVDRLPLGEAPDEVKRQWVGLPLPLRYARQIESPEPRHTVGIITGEPEYIADGVRISPTDGVRVLELYGRHEAAGYWQEQRDTGRVPGNLFFDSKDGRWLPDQMARFLFTELVDF